MKISVKETIAISIIGAILTANISVFCAFYDLIKIDTKDGYIYYSIQHESNPLSINLDKYQKTYNDLNVNFSRNGYQYLEVYYQYLEPVQENHKKYYTVENELEQPADTIQAVQISANVLNHAKLSRGRYFKKKDYIYHENDDIPVLMGSDYEDIYDVGDLFQATYLYQEYTFQIVGFLQKGTEICAGERSSIADRFVIMPSFNINDNNIEENDGYRIHYANKISGLVLTHKYNDSDMEKINDLLADGDIGQCTVQVFPYKYRKIWGLSVGLFPLLLIGLFIIEFLVYSGILALYKRKSMQCGRKIYFFSLWALSLLALYGIDMIIRKMMGIIILNIKSIFILTIITLLSYAYIFIKI